MTNLTYSVYRLVEVETADDDDASSRQERICLIFLEVNELEVRRRYPPWSRSCGWKRVDGQMWKGVREGVEKADLWDTERRSR